MAKEYTTEDIRALGEIFKSVMETGYKHDPSTTVSTWVGAHGPQGLFSRPGIRPDMYSIVPRPIGLVDSIPMVGSRYVNERFALLTGLTATEGTRAVDICSEGPMAGKLKVCHQNIPFGEFKIDTSVERLNRFGKRIDYADMDRQVLNLESVGGPLFPSVLNNNNINTDTGKKLYETYLAIEKSYTRVDINGVAGGTTAPAGEALFAADYTPWIAQYDGLGQLIRTGYTDQPTGVACPAADSLVITHNAPIGSNGTNGRSFIANMMSAIRGPLSRSRPVGMGDVQLVIVIHPNAAWGLADQWACAYNTDRCAGSAGNPNFQNAVDVSAFRDQMLTGQYLLVDGRPYPFVYSNGLQWDGISNNTFNTDILVVPMRWRGGALLYRQYFPLNNPDATAWGAVQPGDSFDIINNGLYAVGMRTTNGFCSKLEFYSQNRLILDAPFLAARVNDVQITYLANEGLDVYPGMSAYRDGGQSTQP